MPHLDIAPVGEDVIQEHLLALRSQEQTILSRRLVNIIQLRDLRAEIERWLLLLDQK